MSTFGKIDLNITTQNGAVSFGDGNTITVADGRHFDLSGLTLTPQERLSIAAALQVVAQGTAPKPEANTDANALKQAVAASPDPATRTERVARWLLKMAPKAAGVAASLLHPALNQVAEELAGWVAGKLSGEA